MNGELPPDTVITQYGRASPLDEIVFRTEPRRRDSGALSVIIGHVTIDEACHLVQRDCADHSWCRTRYTTVGALKYRNFDVEPRGNKRNPHHGRVTRVGGWGDGAGDDFNLCFEETDTGEDEL